MTETKAKQERRPFQFGIMSLLMLTTITAFLMSLVATISSYSVFWTPLGILVTLSFAAYCFAPLIILFAYVLVPRFGRKCVMAAGFATICLLPLVIVVAEILTSALKEETAAVLIAWSFQLFLIGIFTGLAKLSARRTRISRRARRALLPDRVPPPQLGPEKYPAPLNEHEAMDWTTKD